MEYTEYNHQVINTVSKNDGLLACYLKALDDIEYKYKHVHIRFWNIREKHARYIIDIEYRNHKAQATIWGQDGETEDNTEVFYSIISLVSNKQVALRRVFVNEGKIQVQ